MKLKKILAAVFALAMVTVIAAVSVSAHGRNPITEVTKTQVAAEAQVDVKVGDKAPAPKKGAPKPAPKKDDCKPAPKKGECKPAPKKDAPKPAPKKDAPKPGPKHDEGAHHDNGGHHEDHHGDRR